jgi:Protein of unknown function (DUF4231)
MGDGGLGAVVVVVEGIQQLGQYQANWINYRSTAEALGHEKFLFLAGAGAYQAARRSRGFRRRVSRRHGK